MDGRRHLLVPLVAFGLTTLLLAGCGTEEGPRLDTVEARENAEACGGEGCHDDNVAKEAGSVHASVGCLTCHEGTSEAHAEDPKKVIAVTDWTIQGCSKCHEGEAATYLYDDNAQVGPFGGSIREPEQPKAETFPEYKTIVAGHAFTRDYNEEGAHAFALKDHYDIKRGKFDTCMQCKSSKVAYFWNTGKPIYVPNDYEVTLAHTATGTIPPKKVKIPKGTKITYESDRETRVVNARATFPDGKTFSSQPKPSEDATQNFNMVWASTIAATQDVMPYGQGCNHCHDPHTGSPRVLRNAMLDAIEGVGTSYGDGGVNPYREGSAKTFKDASAQDQRILGCAQCHVEYTCGKSGVDGKDRDAFGWGKAKDLHATYGEKFGYTQDWKNAIIGEPLIKSQHPETELFWESVHYDAGASCNDCHMPEVRIDGRTFKSHWMTSPYKYSDAKSLARFSEKTGASLDYPMNPCQRCHGDRTKRGIQQQKTVFERQKIVQKLLAESVNGLAAMKASGATSKTAEFAKALDEHRQAHVLWENLIVSENSMGFHNFEEVMSSMASAEKHARAAVAIEKKWAAAKKK